jgi:hypothetical protein
MTGQPTVVRRRVRWRVFIVNRPGLDMLGFDEKPIKRTFPTRAAAETYALEKFGGSPEDRAGWRVEREILTQNSVDIS